MWCKSGFDRKEAGRAGQGIAHLTPTSHEWRRNREAHHHHHLLLQKLGLDSTERERGGAREIFPGPPGTAGGEVRYEYLTYLPSYMDGCAVLCRTEWASRTLLLWFP